MLETLRAGRGERLHPSGHRPRDAGRSAVPGAAARQPRRVPRRPGRRRDAGDPVPDGARRHRGAIRRPTPTLDRSRGLRGGRADDRRRGTRREDDEDERLPMLRAVARAEFGRRGLRGDDGAGHRGGRRAQHRQRVPPDRIEGRAPGSIMRSFDGARRGRAGAACCSPTDSTVEKLDALMWININAVDRFSDEYNIQLAWLRESPPNTANLGSSFTARLRDLKSLLARASGRASSQSRARRPTSGRGRCSSCCGCPRTSCASSARAARWRSPARPCCAAPRRARDRGVSRPARRPT